MLAILLVVIAELFEPVLSERIGFIVVLEPILARQFEFPIAVERTRGTQLPSSAVPAGTALHAAPELPILNTAVREQGFDVVKPNGRLPEWIAELLTYAQRYLLVERRRVHLAPIGRYSESTALRHSEVTPSP